MSRSCRPSYASLSVWNFVDDLDAMLRAMLPDEDWSLIRRVAGRLKGRSHRARPIEVGLPHARDLYLSGLEAMREVEAGFRRLADRRRRSPTATALRWHCWPPARCAGAPSPT